jgi:ribonuclease BN (tRNA processing enzyme)
VFEDEHIVLVPIVAGDVSLGCPWCIYASKPTTVREEPSPLSGTCSSSESGSTDTGAGTSDSTSSDDTDTETSESTSSDDTSVSSKDEGLRKHGNGTTNGSADLFKNNVKSGQSPENEREPGELSDSPSVSHDISEVHMQLGDDSEVHHCKRRKGDDAQKLSSNSLFSDLDAIFTSNSGRARGLNNVALSRIKAAHGDQTRSSECLYETGQDNCILGGRHPLLCKSGKPSDAVRLLKPEKLKGTAGHHETSEMGDLGSRHEVVSNGQSHGGDSQGNTPVVENEGETYEWIVENKLEHELPDISDNANPVYAKSPCGEVTSVANIRVELAAEGKEALGSFVGQACSRTVLGFVCFLKKLNTGILVVDCRSPESLESLHLHPVLKCVQGHASGLDSQSRQNPLIFGEKLRSQNQHPHSVAAIIDLSPFAILKTASYDKWLKGMVRQPVHVVVQREAPEFGFCSSLETLAKLNVINKQMFPLPCDSSVKGMAKMRSNDLADGRKSSLEAFLLTRVVLEKGINKVVTSIDHSECPKGLNTQDIPDRFLETRPQLQGAKTEAMASAKLANVASANQLAAATVRKNLLLKNKKETAHKSLSNNEWHDQIAASAVSATSLIDGIEIGQSNPKEYNLCESKPPIGCDDSTFMSVRASASASQDQAGADFELLFLGTGSAEPSKFRGSSGILLQTGLGESSMLFDAGEGVLGQLIRKFGIGKLSAVLMSLECVWLSHKHADHVLGILSLIHARPAQAPALIFFGPSAVKRWVFEVMAIWAANGYQYPTFDFVHCSTLIGGLCSQERDSGDLTDQTQARIHEVLMQLQFQSLKSVLVDHCHEAYGLVVRAKCGWSIVYSGDTRPCSRLVQAGACCTLLIHEATFEDVLADHATRKRHSTVSEALDIGFRMAAEYVILTHFSQRYPQVKPFHQIHRSLFLLFLHLLIHPSFHIMYYSLSFV